MHLLWHLVEVPEMRHHLMTPFPTQPFHVYCHQHFLFVHGVENDSQFVTSLWSAINLPVVEGIDNIERIRISPTERQQDEDRVGASVADQSVEC